VKFINRPSDVQNQGLDEGIWAGAMTFRYFDEARVPNKG